jgi:hypothetical protein
MPTRTRAVALVTAVTLLAGAPLAQAATKKPPAKKGPVPGTVVATLNGTYAHGYPRVTQNVWSAQSCAGTTLAGQQTNNLSASIVPVAPYAGRELTVTFVSKDTLPVSSHGFDVVFFDKACNRLDVDDGHNDTGQWIAQSPAAKQVGMVPLGASYVLLQTAISSTQFTASPDAADWQMVVRIPLPSDVKPTPLVLTGGFPV